MLSKLQLQQIYQTGDIKVNGQVLAVEQLPLDVVSLMTAKVKQRWVTTLQVRVNRSMTDVAYAVAGQGQVTMIYLTKPGSYDQGLGRQSLFRPYCEEMNPAQDGPVAMDDVQIFLNSSGQYIPPRKVNVILIHTNQLSWAESVAAVTGDTDIVVFDHILDSSGQPYDVSPIQQYMKSGNVRSVVMHE